MSAPAIEVHGLGKRFVLHHERPRTFQEIWLSLFHPTNGRREEFWALRDVSLTVRPGESLGIVGPNGSGKSTLLKLIAGILQPTLGTIRTRGRVLALLELGSGFHPELTGRENVFLNGSFLGLSRRDMARRFDDVVAFAELEQFIDVPFKHYSSGMQLRLGFSVAVQANPDILLVDEVLAVGDERFQQKCLAYFDRLRHQDKSLVIVSHDLDHLKRFSDHAVLFRDGRVVALGPTEALIESYKREQLLTP